MTISDATAFPATLGTAAFWPALYPAQSPVCSQIPTLFWLVETTRPATVLALGLTTGDGYFALCQAIAGLGLQSLAWGSGTWDGMVPEPLRQHNARHYAGFSRLTQMASPCEVANRFEDGVFDLILVDGRGLHGEDPAALAGLLQRLTSARGVVLVQGAGLQQNAAPAATVASLLSALTARHPVLHFDPQTDCALILLGGDPLPHLKTLAQAPAPAAEVAALDRLGASHLLAWTGHENGQRQAAQATELARLRQEAAALHARQAERETQLAPVTADLAESRDLRLRDVRLLTVHLETLTEKQRQTRLEAEAELARLRQEMQAAAGTAAADLAALRIRHFDESSDLQSEIFVLTQDLVKARSETDAAVKAARKAGARVAALTTDLTRVQADLATAKASHHTETTTRQQQISGLEQALALREQTCAMLQSQIATLRQDAATREALHQVQVKLRDWHSLRLGEKPRFGGPPGPSGGKLADEVAAVARHPLFDADWYLSAYPDTQGTTLSAAEHFLRHGFYEGRNPGPRLRLLDWFIAHPEALTARQNPLLDPDLAP